MKPLQKIDSNGIYTAFPGVTVISPIDHRELELWRQVHACISGCEMAARFYAPLPAESYHMTAVNLYVEASFNQSEQDNWAAFLTTKLPFFSELDAYCKANPFTPLIDVVDVEVAASIRLLLRIPHYHCQLINRFAELFHIEHHLPDVFHMTLGYQYKAINTNVKQAIKAQIRQGLEHIFSAIKTPPRLKPPTLCYFHNMEAFEPWDGRHNPFTSEMSAPDMRF